MKPWITLKKCATNQGNSEKHVTIPNTLANQRLILFLTSFDQKTLQSLWFVRILTRIGSWDFAWNGLSYLRIATANPLWDCEYEGWNPTQRRSIFQRCHMSFYDMCLIIVYSSSILAVFAGWTPMLDPLFPFSFQFAHHFTLTNSYILKVLWFHVPSAMFTQLASTFSTSATLIWGGGSSRCRGNKSGVTNLHVGNPGPKSGSQISSLWIFWGLCLKKRPAGCLCHSSWTASRASSPGWGTGSYTSWAVS